MEEAKQSHRDHLRNKRKYKGKSFKDPKHVPPKSTRNLAPNWDRYEKESDSPDFQLTSSMDFSILASAPISKGHHFQFKSDKIIAEEIENKVPAELFSLNLNLLRDSILTIPFYNRVGIDPEYFTENQLKFMNGDAEINLTNYSQMYLKETVQETMEALNREENRNLSPMDAIISTKKEQEKPVLEVIDIKEVSNQTDPMEIKELHQTKKSEDDLEQWLDNILDD